MTNKNIDIYHRLLKYGNDIVYIAFDDKDLQPYFHANQLCDILDYNNCQATIKNNVDIKDTVHLKDIVKNFKVLYKNVQGNTKFLNEAGLYSLILSSRKDKAKEVRYWITHEVMPSLRKYGEYKLNHKYKKQIDELNKIIYEQKNKIKILEHNLKVPKYDKGGMVYILRLINDKLDFDKNEILYLKFGRTKNMKTRKPNYDTCAPNKVQVLKTLYVDDPKNIEQCVIKRMEEYKIKDKKEYFKCTYNQLINEIASCIKFYEHGDINKEPEISRHSFKDNQTLLFKILNDNEFDEICEDFNSDDEIVQTGGDREDVYIKYLEYKQKYLKLKYDLLI
ncbi:BRO-N domain protein [Catovirus CTV1]|uniref:BRO-N domain protein n=1 Tax=Catovirus CTV1 TaxID=1977631 RepID=A0A1V0S8H5_9VIRU|nr:BRO-N domain protein [Catovirus CTV1]